MPGKPVIYVHKTCASSHGLYRSLASRGLLGSVDLRPAVAPVDDSGHLIWSVPWLLVDGEPAGTDPLGLEVVEAAIRGERLEPPGDVGEAFMEAVLHSALAASIVLVNGSLRPVLDERFVSAALHSPLTGVDPSEAAREIAGREEDLLSGWLGKLARAVAISFVREAWWASGGNLTAAAVSKLVESGGFKTWLLGKASVGRLGLPGDPRDLAENPRVAEAEDFIVKAAPALVRRVAREQEEVLGDEEWMRL